MLLSNRFLSLTVWCVAIGCLLLPRSAAWATSNNFILLENPVAQVSPLAINNRDQILGYYPPVFPSSGQNNFLYEGGAFTTLNLPAGMFAWGMNDRGDMVGELPGPPGSPGRQGFLSTKGTFTTMQVPGVTATVAYGINNSGTIVGTYFDAAGSHGFVEKNGSFTTIDVPGAVSTSSMGINNRGQVVGNYFDGSELHGFLETNEIFTAIDVPGATAGTFPRGINDRGQVVGLFFDSMDTHGFIATNGAFTTIDVPVSGAFSTRVTGINNAGLFVGAYFTFETEWNGFLDPPSELPEPGSLLLLI
jgi:uncharacterized membrane protein